jgi:membrane protein DedA with SNARE-associated domain
VCPGAVINLVLLFGAFRFRHHFHGPPLDYATVAAAAAASWVGVPGPGEPVLITAGVLAARHRLDIGSVLLVAWAAATAGGVAGWYIGMHAGRAVLTTTGPFHGARRRALARGEEVFKRWTVIAILLTPSWTAGILRVRARIYLPTNAAGALVWAVGIGLGAYLIGPAVVDVIDDVGWLSTIGLVVLVVAAVALEVARRRRRQRRAAEAAPPQPPAASH